MNIIKSQYLVGQTYHLSGDLDFSNAALNPTLIRKIKDCHVEININNYGELFRVEINLKSNVVLPCSYTLEDVDYVVKGKEEFDFTEDESLADDEELFYEGDDLIVLDDYIYSILIALVPPKVIKEGASLPKGGKGYEVISEDEYERRKKEKGDSRWSALDNLEFDD